MHILCIASILLQGGLLILNSSFVPFHFLSQSKPIEYHQEIVQRQSNTFCISDLFRVQQDGCSEYRKLADFIFNYFKNMKSMRINHGKRPSDLLFVHLCMPGQPGSVYNACSCCSHLTHHAHSYPTPAPCQCQGIHTIVGSVLTCELCQHSTGHR